MMLYPDNYKTKSHVSLFSLSPVNAVFVTNRDSSIHAIFPGTLRGRRVPGGKKG